MRYAGPCTRFPLPRWDGILRQSSGDRSTGGLTAGLALLVCVAALVAAPAPSAGDSLDPHTPPSPEIGAPSRIEARPVMPVAGTRNCTCRFFGQDYKLGATVCLKGPDGPRLARCAMNLNNTSWKMLERACPSARLDGASGQAATSTQTGTWSDGLSQPRTWASMPTRSSVSAASGAMRM